MVSQKKICFSSGREGRSGRRRRALLFLRGRGRAFAKSATSHLTVNKKRHKAAFYLYEYVKSAENPDDQGFVYTYPNRIFAHFNIDQFNTMKERILTATGSNRAVAVTIDPELDAEREDIPCLQFLQCIVRDNELTIHCLFRSNDIFGAFYSNMFFIAYLGLKMKEEVNKEIVGEKLNFGGVHYHSTSGHIYNTDLKAARKLIKTNK